MKLKLLFTLFFIVGALGWYMALTKPSQYDHLSPSMTYNYVKSVVWYHSRGKLKELESILLTGNLADEHAIKRSIKNMLKHRTSVYLREFNSLDTPIERVGDVYESIFEFTPFLEEVYDVVFSPKDIHMKLNHIADIMESYQTKANKELLDLMNNSEG
ncbi:hypothetical protein [Vibrio mediterranei]|uniref:hypothetical protein n=1 Tax=Vibrio TaxID=662 RepID=UPI004067CBE4